MARPIKLSNTRVPQRLHTKVKRVANKHHRSIPETYDMLGPYVDDIDDKLSAKDADKRRGGELEA